jgi:hypothetical protein
MDYELKRFAESADYGFEVAEDGKTFDIVWETVNVVIECKFCPFCGAPCSRTIST